MLTLLPYKSIYKFTALIVLAGLLFLLGCNRSESNISDQTILAEVNGEQITVGYFKKSLELTLSQIPEAENADHSTIKKNLLEQLIQDKLLVQEANRRQLDQNLEYQELIWRYTTRELARAIRDSIFNMPIEIDPGEIEDRLPQVNRRVWAWEMMLDSATRADSLRQELQMGADFKSLAEVHSISRTAPQGGYLGEIRIDTAFYSDEIKQTIFAMNAGDISQPLPIEDLFVILKVDSIYPPPTLEKQRKMAIREQISRERRAAYYQNLRTTLLKETADVKNFPEKLADLEAIDDTTVVAQIGEDRITFSLLQKYMENKPKYNNPADPVGSAKSALDNLLEDVLFRNEAIQRGYDQDADFQARLSIQKQYALKRALVELISEDVTISAETIEKYYRDHPEIYEAQEQVRARHILVNDLELARDILTQLNAGVSFGKMVHQYSLDAATTRRGGDLGFVSRGQMSAVVDSVLFALETDQISNPVASDRGIHIFQALDRRMRETIDLDTARPGIEAVLERVDMNDRMKLMSNELRQVGQITINEDILAQI